MHCGAEKGRNEESDTEVKVLDWWYSHRDWESCVAALRDKNQSLEARIRALEEKGVGKLCWGCKVRPADIDEAFYHGLCNGCARHGWPLSEEEKIKFKAPETKKRELCWDCGINLADIDEYQYGGLCRQCDDYRLGWSLEGRDMSQLKPYPENRRSGGQG